MFKGISWDSLRINEFCCFMLRRHRNDKLELNEQQKTSAFKENEFSPTMLTNFSIGNVTHHQARMHQGVRLKNWPCLAAGGCIKSPPSAGSTSKGHSPAVKLTMTQTFQLQQYFKQNTNYLHDCIKIRSRCYVRQFFLRQVFCFSSTIEEWVVFRSCFRTCHWSKSELIEDKQDNI